MQTRTKFALFGFSSIFLLSACFQSLPQASLNRQIPQSLTAQSQKQPVFGNTATNIQKIKQAPYNGTVRFVLLGDNRNSTPFSSGGNKIYSQVINKINELHPNFAVNLGDFTFDALKPHWRKFEKLTSASQVPYLTVVGNHDIIFGRNYYESNYTPPNPATGLNDYSFDYGNMRFIAVDSANYTYTERQFAWLEQKLNTPLKKFVFTHTPPRHGVWNHKLSPSKAVSERFMRTMEKSKVDHVFMGHVHLYDQRQVNGIKYTVSGGAGAPLERGKGFGKSLYHVVLVEVNGNQITTRLVPINTKIRTEGPTAFSDGLTPKQMNSPNLLKNYPKDFIPVEENTNN